MTPKKALAAYFLTAIVFLLGTLSLYHNVEPQLREADDAINEGTTLVLKEGIDQNKLSDRLYTGGYIDDLDDANFIASNIKKYLDDNGSLPNLGSLLQSKLKVSADTALKYGDVGFKTRIKRDYYKLGITNENDVIIDYQTFNDESDSIATISCQIKNKKGRNDALAGIPVRIKRYNVLKDIEGNDSIAIDTLGVKLTDNAGSVKFGVKQGKYYSVLPIKRGFQYGREKGTTKGALSDKLEVSFIQSPHVLTLLSPQAFSDLKYDKTLVVRTPAEFKASLMGLAVAFILGWGVFLLFIFQIDKKLGTRSDYLLIIALMIISGIGLLTSYGIWNPLTDTLYGSVMTNGLLIGLIAMGAVTLVNYAKLDARLTSSKWWILRNYGWTVLACAFGLLCMLYLFGTGPEGSDAKVNLSIGGIPIQPSEISRVLIVIFIAWFFARKATLIQDFSQRLTKRTAKRQLATILWIILGVLALMMAYLILRDMGPALVVLVSFILIYSMARRDFAQLLLGLLTFIVLMLGTRWLIILMIGAEWLNEHLLLLLIPGAVWFIAWIGYWYWKEKQIYESAVFLNLVIVVFSLAGPMLESIGQHGLADRLSNRTDMSWEGVWNNEVLGGDQVVQGIWSLATGGFTGLGLGNGSPAIVPAGHTDMIFTTIGEMLGLVGLALVVLCFFVIIHRTLLIGRRAGYTFPFYLATGLGIVIGVQFLVIVAGSIGLLPLTGVTLPFLSYGRVSLIISLASFGFVVSISRLRANKIQREYTNSFNGSIVACSGLFMLIGIILLGTAAKYQILSRGETLIRPAYLTNTEGARIVEYNPRIGLVLRKLEAGNIYDRNGVLLATSTKEELKDKNIEKALKDAGVSGEMLKKEIDKHRRRYYPFGDHLLFMLGDYNTRTVFGYTEGNPIGYLAESRHFGDLRGIHIKSNKDTLTAQKYKENRFVDAVKRNFTTRKYDYSNLLKAGFLDYGIERNPVIEKHNKNRSKRDLTLTIDAKLQTGMQMAMASAINRTNVKYNKFPDVRNIKDLRASVVVLDAEHGDLLCSANYPLPNQEDIVNLYSTGSNWDVPFEKIPGHRPVTERDLGLTFQSAPGSTAKIMTAMAGLTKMHADAFNQGFEIKTFMNIEKPNAEPNTTTSNYNRGGGRKTYMDNAIVYSSNCYFIMSLNENDLYDELGEIYWQVGASLNNQKSVPFAMAGDKTLEKRGVDFDNELKIFRTNGLADYQTYMSTIGQLPESTPWGKNNNRMRSIQNYTGIAWGQSKLTASPLNMARVAGIVANDGMLAPLRFTKGKDDLTDIKILESSDNELLKSAMKGESKRRGFTHEMGGKTGTPMRTRRYSSSSKDVNDAWYIFFVHSAKIKAPISVAVRLERSVYNSGLAVQFVKTVVLPELITQGYL